MSLQALTQKLSSFTDSSMAVLLISICQKGHLLQAAHSLIGSPLSQTYLEVWKCIFWYLRGNFCATNFEPLLFYSPTQKVDGLKNNDVTVFLVAASDN